MRKAYDSAFKKWEDFCDEFGHSAFPATPQHIVYYLAYLGVQDALFGAAQTAIAAITDRHARGFCESPCCHILVKRALRGFRRKSAGKVGHQMRPMSHAILERAVAALSEDPDMYWGL